MSDLDVTYSSFQTDDNIRHQLDHSDEVKSIPVHLKK